MIKRATVEDLKLIAPLFDLYRQFYQQKSDVSAAQLFLKDRLTKNQSIIFIISDEKKVVGFTQLYPIFSSVSMRPALILNDLFVMSDARGKGFGELLLKEAIHFAQESDAKSLSLETAHDNPAQKLYEKLGWKLNEYKNYTLSL